MIYYTSKYRVPFQIDSTDLDIVSQYNWDIDGGGYPRTAFDGRRMRLHLLLLGKAPTGLEWDHIDRDRLNNQRSNLRAVTHKTNLRNLGIRSTNTTGVAGIRFRYGRWTAYIRVDGVQKHLGSYRTLTEAKQARLNGELCYWRSSHNAQGL